MVDKVSSQISANSFGSYSEDDQVTFLPYSAFDSSRLATYAVSVFLIVYGSFRSLNLDSQHNSRMDADKAHIPHWCHWHILGSWQAALMPLAASVSLLVMFLYFESLQLIFVMATCILATAAFAFLLLPICQMLLEPCLPHRNGGSSILCLGKYHLSEIVSAIGGATLVSLWLITGHWLLMDLLAMGLCVAFIALVRLPSLKVSTLLLVGLLIYDIFWVFFSSYLFETNVMVRVATRTVDSPLAVLVGTFGASSTVAPRQSRDHHFAVRSSNSLRSTFHHSPQLGRHHIIGSAVSSGLSSSSTKLSLPGKLVFPSWQGGRYTMLGLGDIVVPGLLLCFVLRYDAFKRAQQQGNKSSSMSEHSVFQGPVYISTSRLTYFRCSLIGYFFGLITATICSEFFRSAQPALLYLVPFTMIPLVFLSYMRGDLPVMWNFSGIQGSHNDGETEILLKPTTSSPALLVTNAEDYCSSLPPLHDPNGIPLPTFDSPPPYTQSDMLPLSMKSDVNGSV